MKRIDNILRTMILCATLLLCSTTLTMAQEARLIPEIEPSSISIGEQALLKIRMVYPSNSSAELILPKDTLVTGVEILGIQAMDSAVLNDKLKEIEYQVVLTSFDSATYLLHNIKAAIAGTLVEATDPPSLIVNTVPVDLEHPEQYADIKGQWKPDFVWMDYALYLYIFIGLIIVGLLIFFIIKYLRRSKSDEVSTVAPPPIDPYEEAIQGMQQLKSEGLWEKNQVKEYYTRMTDILRHYLWRVYGMETAEKTSSEILQAFNDIAGRDHMYVELKKILQTADLAKFAQYNASSDENVSLMYAAVSFIEENKPVKDIDPKEDEQRKEGEV